MNLRYLVKQLGLLLLVLSGILLTLVIVFYVIEALLHHDVNPAARWAVFVSGLVGVLMGTGLWMLAGKPSRHLGRREALLLVAASWLLGAAFAALPYLLWAHWPGTDAAPDHPFRNFVDCYFEAMSGLTTTGATVLSDIESIPESLLLWRATTHWLGGLGIVVLFVLLLMQLV